MFILTQYFPWIYVLLKYLPFPMMVTVQLGIVSLCKYSPLTKKYLSCRTGTNSIHTVKITPLTSIVEYFLCHICLPYGTFSGITKTLDLSLSCSCPLKLNLLVQVRSPENSFWTSQKIPSTSTSTIFIIPNGTNEFPKYYYADVISLSPLYDSIKNYVIESKNVRILLYPPWSGILPGYHKSKNNISHGV